MMDTDTACTRQQVMLCAKYSGDTTFSEERQSEGGRRRERERERQTGKRRRKKEKNKKKKSFWFHPGQPVALTILSGDIDVEVQTILVLVLYVGGDYIQVEGEPDGHHDLRHGVVDVLRADGGEVGGVLDP